MTALDLQTTVSTHLAELRRQGIWYWAKEGAIGFCGLFFFDIAWRFMDWIIDAGLIAHMQWLKFLGSD